MSYFATVKASEDPKLTEEQKAEYALKIEKKFEEAVEAIKIKEEKEEAFNAVKATA